MASGQGFLLGKNATLVCMGDSITQAEGSYVTVMENLITAAYPERNIRVINAGVSGNKVTDMLARVETDVIARRPQCVTINVGINDVWHGFMDFSGGPGYPDGEGPHKVPLEEYEATLGHLVDVLRETTDTEIVLLTPTVIGEDVDNPDSIGNAKLERYVAAMRRVAASRNTLLAPTHEDFLAAIRAGKSVNPHFRLTTDGVHMNAIGNHVMALTVLATLGFAGLGE